MYDGGRNGTMAGDLVRWTRRADVFFGRCIGEAICMLSRSRCKSGAGDKKEGGLHDNEGKVEQ